MSALKRLDSFGHLYRLRCAGQVYDVESEALEARDLGYGWPGALPSPRQVDHSTDSLSQS